MIKHVIKLPGEKEDTSPIIKWSLVIDGNALCLMGDDGDGERCVITIYASGQLHRHCHAALIGLDVDAKGRIPDYLTPREVRAVMPVSVTDLEGDDANDEDTVIINQGGG